MNLTGAKDYILRRLITELPKNLYYHGAHHTFDVVKVVKGICGAENIDLKGRILLETAAYFHDAGFLYQYDANEEIGAQIAGRILPDFEYENEDIEIIQNIIRATAIDIQPKTLLEQIMCDADHDYFGRTDYKFIANNLRKELSAYGYDYNDKKWREIQISFLEDKHCYYTAHSLTNRLPGKIERITMLKGQMDDSIIKC